MDPENKSDLVIDNGRRKFLLGAGMLVAAAATPFAVTGLLGCSAPEEVPASAAPPPTTVPVQPMSAQTASLPWKYAKLDPVKTAERGYAAYSQGGCMYGTFEGIVGELREEVGPPFDAFPAAMMKYGKAGVNGWGTLCGCLNGAAAAIYMVTDTKTGDALIDQLYSWYSSEMLPNYKPKTPKFDIKQTASESPLCHVSVTRWCEASGFAALSPERAERCAQLTASVAKKAVELLNDSSAGTAIPAYSNSSDVAGCLTCHGKGGVKENVHMSKSDSCTICHEPHK
ncbi:MAG: hypothetical protein A2147_11555 [Chloroflexi bacterium RBG_16_57_8]|nr:MAG: hypothetical protein A2147_11555 [Chloroflexi bacterium RBG_16_57_8]